ncbi:MAG: hypothetical protein IJ404_07335 [Clostridia bacterium]|nr:hypothetical protein [Clostridia bacterium]
MKKIITALALISVVLGMTSCTRGGNIDRGDDGLIGQHGSRHESTTEVKETDKAERRNEEGLGDRVYDIPDDIRRGLNEVGDDIYNLPHNVRRGMNDASEDIKRGLNDMGDDIHDGAKNAEENLKHGLNLSSSAYNKRNAIK